MKTIEKMEAAIELKRGKKTVRRVLLHCLLLPHTLRSKVGIEHLKASLASVRSSDLVKFSRENSIASEQELSFSKTLL